MITRNITFEELKNFKWKCYPLNITSDTDKNDIINFLNSKLILTCDKAFDQYPVYINTISNEIIIITKDNRKIIGMYDHIKGNFIKIKINDKWLNWSEVKNKIKRIIFFDSLEYHESVRNLLWSERGFDFIKFYQEGIKDKLINELLKFAYDSK